jgi:hypothetical protein
MKNKQSPGTKTKELSSFAWVSKIIFTGVTKLLKVFVRWFENVVLIYKPLNHFLLASFYTTMKSCLHRLKRMIQALNSKNGRALLNRIIKHTSESR